MTSAIMGGDFKAIVAGAVTGGIFGGIGDIVRSEAFTSIVGKEFGIGGGAWAAKGVLHAAAGGVTSVIQGGDFGSGFLSAGFAALAGPSVPDIGFVGNTLARTVIGGTASLIGGGKFDNGAVTAAFAYLFNQGGDRLRESRARHELGVKAAAADYDERGYDIVTRSEVAVDIPGFNTPNPDFSNLIGGRASGVGDLATQRNGRS